MKTIEHKTHNEKCWEAIQQHPAWLKRKERWDKIELAKRLWSEAEKMEEEIEQICDHKYTEGCNCGQRAKCVICGKNDVPLGIDVNGRKYDRFGLVIKRGK